MNERHLFVAALDISDEEARATYLDRACDGDKALRERVIALLRAFNQAGSFLEEPALENPFVDRPGTRIGPYKLLQQIGEGGFGVVYMAEQISPVQRKVALKIIKPGMDSKEVIARFEAERQALAMMNHVNIAHVLDAGATTNGRPYFAMELVRGVPITEYCDANHCSTRERLNLFSDVCRAVSHAHQKGIIHRDLKPSNVMVTLHDGQPVVKVIDFGVAKALRSELTRKTLFTAYGQMIGTPAYMSPEQAEMSGLDVDTRSDIYSLGVLLYELLTGHTPLDQQRLRAAGYAGLQRIIREEEPLWPSTRLSTAGEELTVVAAHRGTDPQRLRREIAGDLDWIVMKALEKERGRRYETASNLAADVQRYLKDEPVEAGPPSGWYRLRKMIRRNIAAVVTASTLIVSALLAVVTLAVSNVRIRQEQIHTQAAMKQAGQAQRLAEHRAEQLHKDVERLKSANALLDSGRQLVASGNWDAAENVLTEALQLRPDHHAIWSERSDLYCRLGLWELAVPDLERQSELHPPIQAQFQFRYALLRLYLGNVEGYRSSCQKLLDRFQPSPDPFQTSFVIRTFILSPSFELPDADARRLMQLLRNEAKNHQAQFQTPAWFWNYVLGTALYRAGDLDEAVRVLRESVQADHPSHPLGYSVLAMALHKLHQPENARRALEQAAQAVDRWTEERFRNLNGDWIVHRGATAHWPIPWWDWLEGQVYYREAMALVQGSSPPEDARLHTLRARSLAGLQRTDRAAIEYSSALRLRPQDPQILLESHRNLAFDYFRRQQWRAAAVQWALVCQLAPSELRYWTYLAITRLASGDDAGYRQTCSELVQRFGATGLPRETAYVAYCCLLRDDALPDTESLFSLAEAAVPYGHMGAYIPGAALYRAGRYEEAIQSFEDEARTYAPWAWEWCFLAMAHQRLGHVDEARRCLANATKWYDEKRKESTWFDSQDSLVSLLLLAEARTVVEQHAQPVIP